MYLEETFQISMTFIYFNVPLNLYLGQDIQNRKFALLNMY